MGILYLLTFCSKRGKKNFHMKLLSVPMCISSCLSVPSNSHSSFILFTQHILKVSFSPSLNEGSDCQITFSHSNYSLMNVIRVTTTHFLRGSVIWTRIEWWKGDFRRKTEKKHKNCKGTLWAQEQRCQEKMRSPNCSSWKKVASTIDTSRELQTRIVAKLQGHQFIF